MSSFLTKMKKIFSHNRKNWLEKLEIRDLENEKRLLDLQAAKIAKEVNSLKEKLKILNEELDKKSDLERELLAQKIKENRMLIKIETQYFEQVLRMSRALFNLYDLRKS